MRLYKAEQIIIAPERQRQEFEPEAMEALRQSILDRGLMQAPVVRDTQDGPVLVAGERRLRSIKDIYALGGHFSYNAHLVPDGMVPTVSLGELAPLDAEEAELDENLKRKDLTWQELASAHSRLHKLRQAQATQTATAQVAAGAAVADIKIHTVADTAKEIHGSSEGWFHDQTRKELIVAKHLDNPEIAKAKSVDEAFKFLKRTEAAERNRELAQEVGKTFTAELHQAINANCLSWMDDAIMANKQFDVILTDPPYGMGADSFGDGGKDLPGHKYNDSHENWLLLMEQWAPRTFLLAKPQAHLYAFCDIDRFHELKRFLQAVGWYVFRTPLIDYKTDSGRVPLPDQGPRRQWEMILYAIKGGKQVTHIYPDVIPCQADPNMTHGAQKPVALYVNLLKRSVRPGDLILDTFAGSGTIFPAAHALQCTATGIEQEQEYFGMCLNRLRELKASTGDLDALMAGLK